MMNKKKYNLSAFFEKLKNNWEYIQLNDRLNNYNGIQTNLSIKLKDGTNANIYSTGLWFIFQNDEFVNEGFITTYAKGFREGKEFIENKTKKALSGFYKSCTNEYIGELHYAYFFNAENYITGYKKGACLHPITFYIETIENIGFAAGVVCAIDLMAKENPVLFDGFYDEEFEQPQQTEVVKTDEVNKELYNNIFKYNAFEVFEKYHSTKSLAENSKTDLNLLFQLFENDNLFVETVELKHYIKWLNSKYNYSLIELKKVNINSKQNIQRTNDYKEYKRTTLKQP